MYFMPKQNESKRCLSIKEEALRKCVARWQFFSLFGAPNFTEKKLLDSKRHRPTALVANWRAPHLSQANILFPFRICIFKPHQHYFVYNLMTSWKIQNFYQWQIYWKDNPFKKEKSHMVLTCLMRSQLLPTRNWIYCTPFSSGWQNKKLNISFWKYIKKFTVISF